MSNITDITRTPSGWRYTLAIPPYGIGWDIWLDGQLIARDVRDAYNLRSDTLYPPQIEVVQAYLSGNSYDTPSMTAGNTAVLVWHSVSGAKEYLLEHSADGVVWSRLQIHAHSGGITQRLTIRDLTDDARRYYRVTPGAILDDVFFASGEPLTVNVYRATIPEALLVTHTYNDATRMISFYGTQAEGEL